MSSVQMLFPPLKVFAVRSMGALLLTLTVRLEVKTLDALIVCQLHHRMHQLP